MSPAARIGGLVGGVCGGRSRVCISLATCHSPSHSEPPGMQPTALDGAREKGASLAASRTAGEAECPLRRSHCPRGGSHRPWWSLLALSCSSSGRSDTMGEVRLFLFPSPVHPHWLVLLWWCAGPLQGLPACRVSTAAALW